MPSKTETEVNRHKALRRRLLAVTHPTREAILRVMRDRGVMSPSEIAPLIGETTPNTSHHMKVLREADCIELVDEGRVRGAIKHFYRAIDRPLVETDEWESFRAENPDWAAELLGRGLQVVLDDALASARAGLLGADKNTHISRTPMTIDLQGVQEGMRVKERCREEMLEVARRSAERLSTSGESPVRVSSALLFFEVPGPS